MAVVLLQEDCKAVMRRYPDKYFDLAIVDPPYGNKHSDALGKKDTSKQLAKRKKYHEFDNVAPDQEYFDELKRVSKHQIIWGGNFFGLSGGYICWNKRGTAFGEAELAYCSMFKSVKVYEFTWNGMLQGDMKNKEIRIHPTQKPRALYRRLFNDFAKPNFKILDTHLGSASSAIEAENFGIAEFVGCELSPAIYKAAVKRYQLESAVRQIF